MSSIDSLKEENRLFKASDVFKFKANYKDPSIYQESESNRLSFWEEQANQLHWFKKWSTVLEWNRPYATWFKEGELNACFNCVDTHTKNENKNKAAIIWEGENGDTVTLTYYQLFKEVNKFAYALRNDFKIKKGDRVTIYMPMIPQAVIAILACARIGAIHSVVFGGFSAASLYDRIMDSDSRLVITADGGYRRGSIIPLKDITDQALSMGVTPVKKVIMVNHIGGSFTVNKVPSRDVDYETIMAAPFNLCPPESMNSEDVLFILYTSGTTGKPKGIVHTTGGYLTHAKFSTKAVFDLKPDDIFWCTADVGWITGHTYLTYGPLANGATILMFEGTPDYPGKDRFWELISKHGVSILYTAPTAIRAFMKWGDDLPKQHDLSSLRLLGTVGEPINPEAWMWYYEHIGKSKCPIVDTWWQTETGGIMISNLPALNDMKPGDAGLPLPGIVAKILDSDGTEVKTGGGLLSLTEPWPSMLRGVWGDNERYEDVYWSQFDTYFAGDGAVKDRDGYFKVLGRVDDVLNVAGHRIGTMEVESTLVDFEAVCEAAVVGIPDDLKGQAILAFVILKEGVIPSPSLEKDLINFVANQIGAIAKPKQIIFTPELPKTRSGKIMRRILKALGAGKDDVGDVTTLANPDIVAALIEQVKGNTVTSV